MKAEKTYKVVIIEPSPVIRQGVKGLLEADPKLEVAGCFSDYQAFKDSGKGSAFQLMLVNPTVLNLHRQVAVKSVFSDYPDAAIVALLYSYVDPETISAFDGFVDIYTDGSQLIKKLKGIAETVRSQERGENTDSVDLSDREKEILVSVAKGLTNKEIAEKHSISIHTVISHRKNISRKIGIKTISGLTIYAIFNNLISQSDL